MALPCLKDLRVIRGMKTQMRFSYMMTGYARRCSHEEMFTRLLISCGMFRKLNLCLSLIVPSVRVGTFNVNGKNPDASIRSWVQGSQEGKPGPLDDPDILFFGFQELDLSTGALIYSTSTLLETAWTSSIFSALGEKAGNYVKVISDFIQVTMTNDGNL